ncbi:MAG: DNA cytosine methyltransferase [Bacteroidota bacterium]
MKPLTAISLCSGADGFSLAASLLGIEVLAHVESESIFYDHYKRHWPKSLIFSDLKTVDPDDLPDADIIFGGEPCQGNSVAGQRKGKSDDRYLWPDYFRICKAKRPSWIINENVTGSISNVVLDTKITDLENEGYTGIPFNIPAVAVNACHERQRIWLVANLNSKRRNDDENCARVEESITNNNQLCYETRFHSRKTSYTNSDPIREIIDKRFLWGINDVPQELAEIKAYGNAVVPWIPYVLLKFIQEIETYY